MGLASIKSSIIISNKKNWKIFSEGCVKIYARGSVSAHEASNLIKKLHSTSEAVLLDVFVDWLMTMHGHFGIILEYKNKIFAATDRTASHQIFYTKVSNAILVGNDAQSLVDKARLCEIDEAAILSLSMSGYVAGNRTVLKNLFAYLLKYKVHLN